ncbi:hypothetical protein LQF61_10995 [Tetragenococcus koreensis]|uniref:pLS20_p028 family conjugation system transmembrane protein n=1 Tax=Tetragenococcus TaxID=51668 RepID=UPI001F326271|nr:MULTISPECIES: hypothetical protein [Tetragenococcus]MCF1585723.1 hypothetical protein [Tetragenococcus koreensis]MCF1615356.1 hypothetical protein [Tetragenococcus koreensis]MCF1618101.1 hypothetical protein [Tetragenococcus koreensis]MCF1620583.1 hypothetical protein [Tetragenococcus koreensis]MCF1625153.1 hypothetical protein [Tetragenococcus koreensis]
MDKLLEFQDLLHVANILFDFLRDIGFFLLKMVAWLVDGLSSGLKGVYKLLNFYNYGPIKDFLNEYNAVIWLMASISLAFFGWQLIVSHKLDKDKIVTNIILAMTIFFVLPWALEQGATLTEAGANLLSNERSSSTETFKNNITDLYTVDKNGWKSILTQNDIEEKRDIKALDMSEKVDTSGWWFTDGTPMSDEGDKLLKKKLVQVNGKYETVKMKSFWEIGDPAYYRYSWHPFLITIELITKTIVYVMVIIKTAQLINELGLLYIFTTGIAWTDIGNGQRNKQLVTKIRDTFIVIYTMALMVTVFDMWSGFIADASLGQYVKPLCVIAGAMVVIDGPNFVEQLFGIDAGLSSVGRTVIAATQVGNTASSLARSTTGVAKGSVSKTIGAGKRLARGTIYAGAAGKGALAGFSEPKKSTSSSSDATGENSKTTKETPMKKEGLFSKNKAQKDKAGKRSEATKANKQPITNESTSENKTNRGQKPLTNRRSTKESTFVAAHSLADNQKAQQKAETSTVTPLGKTRNSEQLRRKLNGQSAIKTPEKVKREQLPEYVQATSQQLRKDQEPRKRDLETVGEKAVGKYAQIAQHLSQGSTAQRARKVYDVSRSTSKKIKKSKDK